MAPVDERAAVRRLLDRFGFGARPEELDAGYDATVTRLLAPAPDRGVAATPPPDLGAEPQAGRDEGSRKRAAEQLRDQTERITLWWLDRMIAAEAPLAERLTWFWHGHFATSVQKVRSARLMLAQNETMRRLGRGDFGALARAMISDPALVVWLDGQRNKVGSANENLAREFMELFTLGVGHYSETDVREAARALTGWRVDRAAITANVVPRQHDARNKTVLGVTGPLDAGSLVDVLLARPECPRFLARRLWFRLVSSAEPAEDTVERLVAGYGAGRDISGLLRAIAAEPGFRDASATLVKQPVEWLVGLFRSLHMRLSTMEGKARGQVLAGLRGLGQVPFAPPSVGGWPSGAAWLTTSSALARLHLAQTVAARANLRELDRLSGGARVEAVCRMLGIDRPGERTAAALRHVADEPRQLVATAACAPEYVVSG